MDYLEEIYSPSYEIVHYIGSQFPTVSPVIERVPLSAFRSPEASKRVTGISTFYIPPKDALEYDQEMVQRMKITVQAHPTMTKSSNTSEYTTYGKREQDAIKALDDFKVSQAHAFTPLTEASNCIEELSLNPGKLERHLKDSKKELQKHPEISTPDARNLAKGQRVLVRGAVKPNSISSAEKAAIRILTDVAFAGQYKEKMKSLPKDLDVDKKLTK